MNHYDKKYDCVIIGGGMFGLYAAFLLSSKGARIAIIEQEKSIFSRASRVNQSRVHRGYHYPRSFETARKAANYYERFCRDFDFALLKPFKQYYSVAKNGSEVSIEDYVQFCKKLQIPLKEISSSLFFKANKVYATFEAEEACFNYLKIKEYFLNQFESNDQVDIHYQTFPTSYNIADSNYVLNLNNGAKKLVTPIVINAAYSNVNEVNKLFGLPEYQIKYELCELALCQINNGFSNAGVTVMDGPFFSLMPFADGNMFTLSHVCFTPMDTSYSRPQTLMSDQLHSSWAKMESVARDYLRPEISLRYQSSIFEIKPILLSSEKDDSRPTIITAHSEEPLFISILAGKISNIYDLDNVLKEVIGF